MEEEGPKEPFLVRLKYYATLTLGLTACVSCFVFFFLIPFILDPSVSTLVADFVEEPVVCKTVLTEQLEGMKNCSWSSCKQGCTVDQYKCDRIFVNYMHKKYEDFDASEYYEDDDDIWVVKGVPIFVNIKGCGYPPYTNCTVFGDEFGSPGTTFPCYYARANPGLVITNYSWESAVHPMIMALILPNLITGLSLGLLSYWWYPGCQKGGGRNYHIPPDQQSQQGEGDEEEEGGSEERRSTTDSGGGEDDGGGKKKETKIDLLGDENTNLDCKAAMEPEK